MEVHHHHHHGSLKKTIKGHLFDFLMLFLAVSGGFFVENLRENYVEGRVARVLTASLIKDLQKDTAQLSWLFKFDKAKETQLDSFYTLLNQPLNKVNSKTYFRLAKLIQVTWAFAPSNGTTNQLKNAGYLRYFSNDSLPGLISEYDFLYKDIQREDDIVSTLVYNKYYDILIKTSDSKSLYEEMGNKILPDSIGVPAISPDDLKTLKGMIIVIRRNYYAYDLAYEKLKEKAMEIMEYLKHNR